MIQDFESCNVGNILLPTLHAQRHVYLGFFIYMHLF